MFKKLLTFLCLFFSLSGFTQFATNNLIVSQLGDGSITYQGGAAARCLLQEYSTNGAIVSTTVMPTSSSGGNRTFMLNNGFFGGNLSLTQDSRFLLIAGYDVAELSQPVASFTAQIAPRIVGIIDKNKNINTTTSTGQYGGDAIYSAYSTNGYDIWTAGGSINGSGGVRYLTKSATNSVLINNGDFSNYQIAGFANQLYSCSGTSFNVGAIGSGFPASAAGITNLTGLPFGGAKNIVSFFFADLNSSIAGNDVLYVLNDEFGVAEELSKYSLVGTNWVLNNSITIIDPRGITGRVSGSTVELYIVTDRNLLKLTDNSGYNNSFTQPFIILASAPTAASFKGISFAPENIPLPPPPVPVVSNIQNNCVVKATPGFAKITNWVNGYTIVATKNGAPLTINPVDTSFEYFTPGQNPGTYSIQVKFVNAGQTNEFTINHVVSSMLQPQLALLQVNTAAPYCPNKNISFSVIASNIGDNPTYTWKDGTTVLGTTTTPDFTTQFNSTGQKTINVSVNFTIGVNCLAANTATSENKIIAIEVPTAPTISAGSVTTFCSGGSVTLSSNATTGNQWYNGAASISGATNTTYISGTSGAFSVQATSNGCTSSKSNTINVTVNPLPAAPVITWNGSKLSASIGFTTYQWFLNGTSISGTTTANLTPTASGLYKVTATDANGCSATSSEFNLVATAVNAVTLSGVTYSVSPNPASSVINFKISGNNPGKVHLKMINASGKEILIANNIINGTFLSVQHLPPGIYYILLTGNKEKGAFKIVINR